MTILAVLVPVVLSEQFDPLTLMSPDNVLSDPFDFSGAAWSGSTTVTPNTHKIYDRQEVDTIADNSAAAAQDRQQTVNGAIGISDVIQASVFIRKTSGAAVFPQMRVISFGGTAIDAVSKVNTNTGASISNVGSVVVESYVDYWRWKFTFTNNGSAGNVNIQWTFYPAASADISNAGTRDSSLTGAQACWGAQIITL